MVIRNGTVPLVLWGSITICMVIQLYGGQDFYCIGTTFRKLMTLVMISINLYFCLCITIFIAKISSNNIQRRGDLKFKILFVNAPAVDSHRKSLYPLARKLGQLGHNVTLLVDGVEGQTKVPFSMKECEFVNPAYVMVNFPPPASTDTSRTIDFSEMTWKSDHMTPFDMHGAWQSLGEITKIHLNERMREIERKFFDENWDLVIVDGLFSPLGVLIARMSGSPMASGHTSIMTAHNGLRRQMPWPWSYYPTVHLASTEYDHRSFVDRLGSIVDNLLEIFVYHFKIDQDLMRQYSTYHQDVSSYNQDRASLFFAIAFPPLLDYVRPWTRDVFPFAGTCPDATLLKVEDAELRTFIEDPTSKGTVVIAFGHMVDWSTAPAHVRQSFVQALNLLKDFRIIWQYNGNTTNLALDKHVRCMKWLPQEALLSHSKTKLFISHGGLKSLTETICAGIPALVIPFFAEQIRNAHLLVKSGSGLALSKLNLTTENLFQKSSLILNDEYFPRKIKKLRSFFNDQLMPSVDYGAFWTEFVLKYQHRKKFDRFFRLREASMMWFRAFMIDLFVIYVVIPILSLYFLSKSLRSKYL